MIALSIFPAVHIVREFGDLLIEISRRDLFCSSSGFGRRPAFFIVQTAAKVQEVTLEER